LPLGGNKLHHNHVNWNLIFFVKKNFNESLHG
jgi:hypothetical protein